MQTVRFAESCGRATKRARGRFARATLAASCLALGAAGSLIAATPPAARGPLRVGAAAVDITPVHFPVIINGNFLEGTANRAFDRLYARAIVLDETPADAAAADAAATRAAATDAAVAGAGALEDGGPVAIVVVDSCMLPRELLDAAKALAARSTGVAPERMLISATHTHSAPSCMGVLGSRADPEYPALLVPLLARAIESAHARRTPARVGWASDHAPRYTFCRNWIRWPDRRKVDPFGLPSARNNMNPGFQSPDVIGRSGPADDELTLLAFQSLDGRPIATLANFSMHYIGAKPVSADYFGPFAEALAQRIGAGPDGLPSLVAMSQGTSGDQSAADFAGPERPPSPEKYAEELAEIALRIYRRIKFDDAGPLAMREARLTLERRLPDAARLAWAKEKDAGIVDRQPKGLPEVYAREALYLAAEPRRELKLQALALGDFAITAIPNEVYGITGLKLKLRSPLPGTINISLANGSEGYIPPPEQHRLGGYTTWPARTAALQVEAEPIIVERVLKLLEEASGKPRRTIVDGPSDYSRAVLASRPAAYWPLTDIAGSAARDESQAGRDGAFEGGVCYYLPGPAAPGLARQGSGCRAAHFAGGRLRAAAPRLGSDYAVEFWLWNGLPTTARAVTAYCFSSGAAAEVPAASGAAPGDHLAIGGAASSPGRLIFSNGASADAPLVGRRTLEARMWNHVALVREGDRVAVYLDGDPEPELAGAIPVTRGHGDPLFFGGRCDNFSNLEGRLSEVAVYDRALAPAEIVEHYRAAKAAAPIGPTARREKSAPQAVRAG